MTKPDLSNLTKDQLEYVTHLEGRVDEIDNDGRVAMFVALNTKLIDMAKAVKESTIDLNGDDKVTERIIKISLEVKEISENLKWLRQELNFNTAKEATEAHKKQNPIERRAAKT